MYEVKQLRDEDLDMFIEAGVNVLLSGRHGVGKTALIVSAFERHNLNYRYFSAPTMDPWVDFVGVPREATDDEGNPKLELIRPEGFHNGTVEAIFMDEINRGKEKVRNAVMELIQFGSINGQKFPNLRFVWAAINPEDDDDDELSYDVETLDPAQKDRFQVQIQLPYEPNLEYFINKFGDAGRGAVEWWNELDDKVKLNCSPRRLDEAISAYQKNIDLRFLLDGDGINLDKLRQKINIGSYEDVLERLYESGDADAIKRQFSNINFVTDVIDTILESNEYVRTFLPYLQKDRISAALTDSDKETRVRVMENGDADVITSVVGQIIAADVAPRYIKTELQKRAQDRGLDVVTAVEFATTVKDAINNLKNKDKDAQSQRFKIMLAVNSNFSYTATQDVYENCLQFVAMVVAETDAKRLNTTNGPESQLLGEVVKNMNKAMDNNFQIPFWDVWEKLKSKNPTVSNMESGEIAKIEKFFKGVVN